MKTINIALFFFVLIFVFPSCDEVPIEINRGGGTTDPTDQELDTQLQNVLLEEYTGVKCTNCPAAAEKIEDLIVSHGQRLVTVAIHGGNFAIPYAHSTIDFRFEDADNLLDIFRPRAYPGGTINRKIYPGHPDLDLLFDEWAGIVAEQKELTPKVGLILETSYDTNTRNLKVDTKILTKEIIDASDVRLTLVVTESKIIDVQGTTEVTTYPPDGVNDNYEFNHVLRGFITPFNGESITGELVLNEITEKSHNYTIPDDWNHTNLEVVGLVHLNAEVIEVLQSYGKKLAQ